MEDSLIGNLLLFVLVSAVNTAMSFLVPAKVLNPCNWLFRTREWEREGMAYQKLFRIKKWKNALPELGDFFKGVFAKKKIKRFELDYLREFAVETCRAELTHEGIILSSFLFALWASPQVSLAIITVSIFLNIPFIMIQRHNRPRIVNMLARNNVFFNAPADVTVGN
ncbi:MAG: hypothetical protein LBT59_01155 [Clostridiales bacterium]|jgi:glycosyl-4,4'-diaponeurosporenoate acyltransferase|nr:hypothetical protein [Clostridiales bacterium]